MYSEDVYVKLANQLNAPFKRFDINPGTMMVTYRSQPKVTAYSAVVRIEYRYVDAYLEVHQRKTTVTIHHLAKVLELRLPTTEYGLKITTASNSLSDILFAIYQQAGVALETDDVHVIYQDDKSIELAADNHSFGWYGTVRLHYELVD